MNYLLDTHALIWLIIEKDKLSFKTKQIIENPINTVFVSAISFWEIALKSSIGKLELQNILPEDLPALVVKSGFELLSLSANESSSFNKLNAIHHKDPFDRMLIWQAIQLDLILITKDKTIVLYKSEGLKTTWQLITT